MKYEVLVDGESAFKKTTKDDTFDREVIPAQFRARPRTACLSEEGGEATTIYIDANEITIITDGNVIAVSRPEGVETPAPEITGVGGAVAEDGTGAGG